MILLSSSSRGNRKVYKEISEDDDIENSSSSDESGKRKIQDTEISDDETSWSSDDFENGVSDAPEEWKEDGEGEVSRDTTSTGILEEKYEGWKKSRKNKPLPQWQLIAEQTRTWIAENSDKDTDLMNLNETLSEILEPTDDLIIPLMRFQKEWLAWAVKQEKSSYKGGILADEMGMGKTLQAIALVLFKRTNPCNIAFHSDEQRLPPIKGTLVVCPPIALKQWVQEIDRSTLTGSVNMIIYHGPKRAEKLHHLSACDFLITTYDIVTTEHRMSLKTTQNYKSNLHSVMWNRIILDEAHIIKGTKNKRTRAVLALQSIYKWALSGTPVQNCIRDLYSVIRFLRVLPYSFSFCKECNCSCVERDLEYCPNCSHHKYSHFHWWLRFITRPMQKGETKDLSRKRAMILLKHNIMKNIMLRRTKEGRPADLALPPKIETLRLDSLDTAEPEYYKTLFKRTSNTMDANPEWWIMSDKFSHAQYLRITRIRQAISCGHYFCRYCLTEANALGYFFCLSPFASDYLEDFKERKSKPSSILDSIKLDQFKTSSKIDALREEIRFMAEMDGSAKGIVFSQSPPFLDLIKHALHKSGVDFVIFYGTEVAREASITRFREDPNCRMFLTTFKAGGFALNLTVASHVFLMEPWYNPTVEWQAQDRVHRVGQCKPVRWVDASFSDNNLTCACVFTRANCLFILLFLVL